MSTGVCEPFIVVQPLGNECLEHSTYAKIVSINDDVMVVSFADTNGWKLDDQIAINYLDQASDLFLKAPGCIQKQVDPEPNPTFELAVLDDFESTDAAAQAILRAASAREMPGPLRISVPLFEHLDCPLPGSLLDEDGNILRRKGQILTAQDLEALGRLNLSLGSDWWPAASESDQGVGSHHPSVDGESKGLPRENWITDALIHVLEENDGRKFTGTTHSLTESTISLFSPYYLAVGLRLSVTVTNRGQSHRAVGLVRTCSYQSENGEGTHHIALEFSEDPQSIERFLNGV